MSSQSLEVGIQPEIDCGVIDFNKHQQRILLIRWSSNGQTGAPEQYAEIADESLGVIHVGAFAVESLIAVARLRVCAGTNDGLIEKFAIDPASSARGLGEALLMFAEAQLRRERTRSAVIQVDPSGQDCLLALGYNKMESNEAEVPNKPSVMLRKILD